MKRLMPFVQVVREKIQLAGLNAFNLTLDFDEFKVLQDNKKYLENTLDVSVLDVNFDIFYFIFFIKICFI